MDPNRTHCGIISPDADMRVIQSMSKNIRTFRDLERGSSGPTSQAFPNAWGTAEAQQSTDSYRPSSSAGTGVTTSASGVSLDLGYRNGIITI